MKSKYIEGTEKKYSIREDGQVIRHYKNNYDINQKKVIRTYNNKILVPDKSKRVRINLKSITIRKLLRQEFGFVCCNKCNHKIYTNSNSRRSKELCDNCLIKNQKDYHHNQYMKRRVLKPIVLLSEEQKKINIQKSREKWIKGNPEKLEEATYKRNKRKFKNLPKYEIASRLGLKVSELTDELYNEYKNLILFKRKVAKENNVSISSLK